MAERETDDDIADDTAHDMSRDIAREKARDTVKYAEEDTVDDIAARYYLEPAAAFVRARLRGTMHLPDIGHESAEIGQESPSLPADAQEETLRLGLRAGLRLHAFKRTRRLARVERVLGVLRGLAPESLLDIGSGRGVFLWPLLDAFPKLRVTAIDHDPARVGAIRAVSSGGMPRLTAAVADCGSLPFAAGAFDAVTVLEVLEHLPRPRDAVAESLRVARRAVIASVPSREDDNPDHLRLFTRPALDALFSAAGASRVTFGGVHNHTLVVAMASRGDRHLK